MPRQGSAPLKDTQFLLKVFIGLLIMYESGHWKLKISYVAVCYQAPTKSSGYQSMGYLPGLVIILCILLHTDTSRCNIPEDMDTSRLQPFHTLPYVVERWLLLIYIILL